jgi:hypothetical protein
VADDRRLTYSELASLLGLCQHWDGRPFGRDEREEVVARLTSLITEVRRLRQLVVDAEPYVPDSEQARTVDLPARLKAEVERK